MAHENLVFAIIAVVIAIVLLFIFIRIWKIIKPYIILARKIIKVIDIIKNFTVEVAVTLLHLIKDVISGIYKIFNFDDTIVIALNNAVAKIDDYLDDKVVNKLATEGKRIVITAIGDSADNAVRFANQLVKKLVPVSMVLFDPYISPGNKISKKIHMINIVSKELNISARGSESIPMDYITQSGSGKSEFNIIKPLTKDINGYIEAVKNGFI